MSGGLGLLGEHSLIKLCLPARPRLADAAKKSLGTCPADPSCCNALCCAGGLLGAGATTIYITGQNPLQYLPQGSGPPSAQVDDLRRLVGLLPQTAGARAASCWDAESSALLQVESVARHQDSMRHQSSLVIQSHRGRQAACCCLLQP